MMPKKLLQKGLNQQVNIGIMSRPIINSIINRFCNGTVWYGQCTIYFVLTFFSADNIPHK